jgi:hypothetical protein
MYYLVNVDHNGIVVHLMRSDKCFKKCCISSALDGTDDDILWNGSEEDRGVRSECQEHEGTDCEGGDNDTDW